MFERATAFLALLVHGCAATTGSAPEPADGPQPPPSAAVAPTPSATPTTSSTTPANDAPVVITNLGPGIFEVAVTEPLGLRTFARIERRDDAGTWTTMPAQDGGLGFRLTATCDRPTPACSEVSTTTPMLPVPWSGMSCSSQCNATCDKNVPVGPGVFRLVVDTCDGRSRAGQPFELPSGRREEAMIRWGVSRDLTAGRAMRMHDPDAAKDRAAKDKLIEWRPIASTERALEAADIARLAALLAAAEGYEDDLAKRCAMDHLVGFRLVRAPATTGPAREEAVDVVVDFTCDKIFIRGGTDSHRWNHASHFDPSHAAWRDFARSLFPGDRELARVR